jgi:hypothetical protein
MLDAGYEKPGYAPAKLKIVSGNFQIDNRACQMFGGAPRDAVAFTL